MCVQPYRRIESDITEANVTGGVELVRNGFWFQIHQVKDGTVYFAKNHEGESHGWGGQMPLTEFVKQYNGGKFPSV